MRLFDYPFPSGVPLADAVIHAVFHLRVDGGEPIVVAADAPVPVDFHDAAELTVGGCVEIMFWGADGEVGAEVLMPFVALVNKKFSMPHGSFQGGEEMGHGLCVVPYMGTGAVAATLVIAAAFPAPETSVRLSQGCRGFEDGQIGSHRLHDFWGKGACVEGILEQGCLVAEI